MNYCKLTIVVFIELYAFSHSICNKHYYSCQKNKGGNTKVKRTAAVTSDTTGFKGSVQGNSYNESACIELLA